MALKWTITILAVMVSSLAFAGVSSAHTLKVQRAAKANKTFAKLVCSKSVDTEEACLSSRSGACNRVSDHIVRCKFFLTVELKDGARGRCLGLIEWKIKNGSGALQPEFLGYKTCDQTRPSQPQPAPTP